MITVSQLNSARPADFASEAENWCQFTTWAGTAKEFVDQEMADVLRERSGETVTAALGRVTVLADNCEYARIQAGLVCAALGGLAEELADAQRRLRSALEEAAERGYPVGEDGSVTFPAIAGEDGEPGWQGGTATGGGGGRLVDYLDSVRALIGGPHAISAQGLAQRIGRALRQAEEVDERYARTLAALVVEPGLRITEAMWADAGEDLRTVGAALTGLLSVDDIPAGAPARENAAWWDALSEREQETYLALFPAVVGALDGLPALVRDRANRGVLEIEQARVATELEAHRALEPAAGGPAHEEWQRQHDRLEGQLRGMESIQNRLAAGGTNGLPETFLLGFGTEGNGRAIVAVGNPDLADHTAVYVPGTGARLENIEGDLVRGTRLWRQSTMAAMGESVSTVMWLGYDAPQNAMPFEKGEIIPSATDRGYALEGAPALREFTSGLEVAAGGPDAGHTTVIGHSYGSTVVGAAARSDGGLATDDIVAVGSPGMLVPYAKDLGVGSDHVWSMAAGTFDDVVPNAGRMFLGENDVGVGVGRYGIPYLKTDVIPNVPSDEQFGAHIMANDSTGHSAYWDENSLSLRNQSRVIAGRYDDVELG
ncbi:alpha/beta hydrolase [Streptomyces xiamenensis]